MARNLTEQEVRALEYGARHPDGVIAFLGCGVGVGFMRRAHDKRMQNLVARGLAEPSAHGDHYITEAGRETLKQLSGNGTTEK